MLTLFLQIGVLVLNVYLLIVFVFAGATEVMPAWQRYPCMLVALLNLLALGQEGITRWLVPYWALLEEIMEKMSHSPKLLMAANGLSLLMFLIFIAGLFFGNGFTGAGLQLMAIFAPGLSLYYAYTLYEEESYAWYEGEEE